MQMNKTAFMVVLMAGAVAFAAEAPARAVARLAPTKGSAVAGAVTFERTAAGVHVHADVTGLSVGRHGFHLHEFGDCSAPDGTSAGGHFNPKGVPHGAPEAKEHHAGDLGNVDADAQGHATLDTDAADMRLDGDGSILGRAVIVHAQPDDLKTQPTGNAGARVACGVVGVAGPAAAPPAPAASPKP
jgi:Cu-Zn family superoxide dismutase